MTTLRIDRLVLNTYGSDRAAAERLAHLVAGGLAEVRAAGPARVDALRLNITLRPGLRPEGVARMLSAQLTDTLRGSTTPPRTPGGATPVNPTRPRKRTNAGVEAPTGTRRQR